MRTTQRWGTHIRQLGEMVNAGLDSTLVYALQWAQDPRCIQQGGKHRRVGAPVERNAVVCRLWRR